jgi:hypothetical protein
MQPEAGQIHVGKLAGGVQRCQNVPQLVSMFRVYATRVVLFKKPLQSLCGGLSLSSEAAMRHVAQVILNVSRKGRGWDKAHHEVFNAMGLEGGQKVFVVLVHQARSSIP